jgi:phage I-like protein
VLTLRQFKTLAVANGSEPPKEFRLFVSGWNDTENGKYLFDEVAAKATMAAYAKWGVELAIDLEHQMLDPVASDPTARDARGWFKLELRDDGSLWAVNVRWTEDGAQRLSEKRQRYISPAFEVDPKTKRVVKIINAAITSIPATHDTPALVAASARDVRTLSNGPAFSDVQCAIAAALDELYPRSPGESCSPDGPWVQDVFDASVVFVLKGEFYEAPYTYDGSKAALGAPVKVRRSYEPIAAAAPAPAPAPAPTPAPAPVVTNNMLAALAAAEGAGMDPKLIASALDALIAGDAEKCAEILKGLVASAAGADPDPDAATEDAPPPAGDGGADEGAELAAPDDEDKQAVAAAISRLTRITAKTTIGAAVDEVEVWRTSHLKLEAEEARLAKEREALEFAQRKENANKLVQLGAETPHTSGLATFANGAKGKLAKRLMDEPLDEQNARVAALLAAKGGKVPAPAPVAPPKGDASPDGGKSFVVDGKTIELSARELQICVEQKCDPQVFATLKARRYPTA